MTSSPATKRQLLGYYGFIATAHLLGWGTLLWLSSRYPPLLGLGALAYGFGVRHAFDADHITAIDNVTRRLLASGKNPLGTGFFFSLGHSTVVFLAATILGLSADDLVSGLPLHFFRLTAVGGSFGTAISGLCLIAVGAMNLVILVGILRSSPSRQQAEHTGAGNPNIGAAESTGGPYDVQVAQGGFLYRLFGKVIRRVGGSRQMFVVGILFGLGFDTASEIGLLTVSAGVSAQGFSFIAVLALPLLFAAGMSLMDTSEGAFMARAYAWTVGSHRRRRIYNLTMTGISVAAALTIGSVELLRFVVHLPTGRGAFGTLLAHVDSWTIGIACVVLFAITWLTLGMLRRRRVIRKGEREEVQLAD